MNSLLDILNKSVNYLEKKSIQNARLTAEKVLSEILDIERIMLYANFERVLTEDELYRIREKLNDTVTGEKKVSEFIFEKNVENGNIKSEIIKNSSDSFNSLKMFLDKSISYLKKNNIEEAELIAEIIFSHILEVDRMMLFTKYKEKIEDKKLEKIRNYIQKIGKEKFPVQYLLNEQNFYGRNFYVNKGVLIPRQDTEILVEESINIIKREKIEKPKILDIGSGSGVIGITMALEIPESKVIGVDISEIALEICEKNKEILKVENIKFFKSDLFENVEYTKFDMIVSNPPYIPKREINIMSDDTLLHEPDEALFAENEGLYFYMEISRNRINYLKNNGFLLFEIGYRQAESVKKIMEYTGYKNINIIKDLQNNDRVIIGQKIE